MGDQWVEMPLAIQNSAGVTVSHSSLTNLMLVRLPEDARRRFAVIALPGPSATGLTSGSGSMRGLLIHDEKLWYVRGTQLYYWNGSGIETLVGTVAGTANVRMVGAGAGQIAIVDGTGNQYIATTAAINSFVLPAGIASDVAWMDGYIICPRSGTDEWYISALDGVTFAALDFSTADAISDRIVGAIQCNRDLLLFGKIHTEIWYDAGASPFPFLRASPGVIERGCIAAATIQKADGVVYFIGNDRRAYRLHGYTPVPISTEAIDVALNLGNPSTLTASVYTSRNQLIYAVQTSSTTTLEYNINTGLWHTRVGQAGFRTNFTPTSTSTTNAYHAGPGTGGTVGVFPLTINDVETAAQTMILHWYDQGGRRCFEHELRLITNISNGSDSGVTATLTTDEADDENLTQAFDPITPQLGCPLSWSRLGSFRRRQHSFSFTGAYPLMIEAVMVRMDVGL